MSGTTPLHAVRDLPERPAVCYVSEVSHLHAGRAYCFGGASTSIQFSWLTQSPPSSSEIRPQSVRKAGRLPLHLVSAFATNERLVLGQEAVAKKSNEIVAISALLKQLSLKGTLVSIDAIGCIPILAQSILDAGADYLLAEKDN